MVGEEQEGNETVGFDGLGRRMSWGMVGDTRRGKVTSLLLTMRE